MNPSRRSVLLAAVAAVLLPTRPRAATLRSFGTLNGPAVLVSDLWDDAGAIGPVVLGPAPGPGERIVVEAPQLLAIARQFGVAWQPESGGERSILERPGVLLARDLVEAALRGWFDENAPSGSEQTGGDARTIELTGFVAPLVAPDAAAHVAVENCGVEQAGGRFNATLVVSGRGMPASRLFVSGRVIAMTASLLTTRRLPGGSIVMAGDVVAGQIARERVHGPVALAPAQAEGLLLRRALAEGEPVRLADLAPPPVVAKGGRVLISIDAAGVAVTAIGEAMQPGAVGQRIPVRNPPSRAVLMAEVLGAGRVRVAPGSMPLKPPAADGSAAP